MIVLMLGDVMLHDVILFKCSMTSHNREPSSGFLDWVPFCDENWFSLDLRSPAVDLSLVESGSHVRLPSHH